MLLLGPYQFHLINPASKYLSHSDKVNNIYITSPLKLGAPSVGLGVYCNPIAWSLHCWLVTPLPFLGPPPTMQY